MYQLGMYTSDVVGQRLCNGSYLRCWQVQRKVSDSEIEEAAAEPVLDAALVPYACKQKNGSIVKCVARACNTENW